ncbi:hypothetical protein H0H87_010547 [Tephrocybe sp. NHM501043]|nr:hypothetical protein H0H87_010547 [Tephrocybe sp. NHM501043]
MSTEKLEKEVAKHDEEHQRKIDLANNVQARIQNPLHGISKPTLLAQVDDFAKEQGMEDITYILKKGALLAQNPKDFENIEELDEEDKVVIRREITRWDQTGSNGANLSFPDEFGISIADGAPNRENNEWIVGLINSG